MSFLRRLLSGFLAVGLLIVGALPVETTGQLVRGQVLDSLTGAPIGDALVTLSRLDGEESAWTFSDSRGVFLLRGPHTGQYRLIAVADGFRRSAFPPFDLDATQMRSYVILVPPVAAVALPDSETITLATSHCGSRDDRSPIIVGVVTDESGLPVAGATVYASTTASDGMVETVQGDGYFTTVTREDGSYALCSVPSVSRISLHATMASHASRFAAVLFGTSGVFADDAFHQLTRQVWRQNLGLVSDDRWSTIVAGVVTDTSGMQLDGVTVQLVGAPYQAETDATGRFTIGGLTQGSVRLMAKSVGYSPVELDVELVPNRTLELAEGSLTLAPFPVRLREIVVTGEPLRANPRLDGFFQRRETNPRGKFATETEWQNRLHLNVTDITSRLRYDLEGSFFMCSETTSYFLDGVFVPLYPGFSINDFVDPTRLAAVEAYGNGFDAPARYRRRGCGPVVLLWSH